jgi:hypothetical protein
MELASAHAPGTGSLMATVRHVFMLDYVAEILGEHPDLIHAVVSNDDNLTWGSIIRISFGPDGMRSAITDDGIDELRTMIAEARRSSEEWDSFLECVVYDDDEMEAIRAHYAA